MDRSRFKDVMEGKCSCFFFILYFVYDTGSKVITERMGEEVLGKSMTSGSSSVK